MPSEAPRPAPALFYGWVIVGVVFLTLFYALGIRYAYGVFYVAILNDMGWSRADTAGVLSLAMVSYTCTAILSGLLLDRLGPRLLFPIGALVFGGGLMLSSRITSLGELYIAFGVFVGIGLAFLGFIPHMALVTRWFIRRRGLATSIALSGLGLGAMAMAKLTELLIRGIGWREAFFWYGAGAIAILIPLTALFHRSHPAAMGLAPDGALPPETGMPQTSHSDNTVTLRRAVRQPVFWTLLGAVFMIGWNSNTMAVHQARLMMDLGLPLAIAATLFGLSGLFRAGGIMVWGPLSDRIGRRTCAAASAAMGALALVILFLTGDAGALGWLALFVLLWGLGFDGIAPLYASTVADRFHGRNLGLIFGVLDLGFGMGGAAGPWVTGYLFDRTGSYDIALGLLLLGCMSTGALLWISSIPRSVLHARQQ